MNLISAFESPRLTLKRAKHHIHDLKEVIQAFKNEQPQPWSYEIDTDSQPPNTVYKIKFYQLPPTDATCILFDAVNNLRATLDQIGYSAAIASGKIKPERTKFLFGNDVKDPSKWKSTGLPTEIVDLFRSVEPYEGGNGQRLWAVNRLCNLKKHSQLVPTRITGAVARFGAYFPDFTAAVTGFGGSNWMTNEHEFILMVRPPGDPTSISRAILILPSLSMPWISFETSLSLEFLRERLLDCRLAGLCRSYLPEGGFPISHAVKPPHRSSPTPFGLLNPRPSSTS